MTYSTLLLEHAAPVATITLNRPEVLNALDSTTFNELEHAFMLLDEDAKVRVILLTGAGDRAFAAGADIRALLTTDAGSGKQTAERGQRVFSRIERCTKPVLACVNGVALGGGCELALACTLRLASDRARLGLPEAKLGLIPGYGGTQRLPRLIGRSAALRMMITAEIVDAARALSLGLVDEVVAAAELMPRAHALAATIADLAPGAIQGILEALQRGEDLPLENALRAEADIFGRLCGTADKREGLTAFLEKRKPVWQAARRAEPC